MREEIQNTVAGMRILVTGGTGSLGHHIVRAMLPLQPSLVRVFSRDEKKQNDMRAAYEHKANLEFTIGDIRDLDRVRSVIRGIDIVINAAALKHVPLCEHAPLEAVKTNVLGASNLRQASIEAGVQTVVSLSTDKAVKPVNVMGMTKAIHERIMLDPSDSDTETRFLCVRYGNVLGSRGSVVPFLCDRIARDLPLPITHPEMTRFLLTLDDAIQLVFSALYEGESGEVWVRKAPSVKIIDLANALSTGIKGHQATIEIVGLRPGEKIHELLVSREEMWRATETVEHFRIRGYADAGDGNAPKDAGAAEYSSACTDRFSMEDILHLLEAEGWLSNRPAARGRNTYSTESPSI